jgi:hypothetical protein
MPELEYEEQIGREAFVRFTRAVRAADQLFQKNGDAGTRTWLRDYLFPEMQNEGLHLSVEDKGTSQDDLCPRCVSILKDRINGL